ncbi:hypothetical protein SAMN04488040_1602 [Sulfitobacter marinus]|uniref:TFIIB zinc-binding n=1 Tax=Sulfitobacter marinus TaxID=394264 RepID=A0A1I6RW83_9RHOB|nr:hypothetical protein [Sulfitobacter marinus]SFS68971.1 hypothetical protein SAMN04488040_1602 [Sulfitobacter marinus]
MAYPTKIATCCFCGSKAALTLDVGRHELSCAQCGAPLHDLKQIPVSKSKNAGGGVSPALRRFPSAKPVKRGLKPKVKRQKRRKSWLQKMASDVFEDVFDAVEDILIERNVKLWAVFCPDV